MFNTFRISPSICGRDGATSSQPPSLESICNGHKFSLTSTCSSRYTKADPNCGPPQRPAENTQRRRRNHGTPLLFLPPNNCCRQSGRHKRRENRLCSLTSLSLPSHRSKLSYGGRSDPTSSLPQSSYSCRRQLSKCQDFPPSISRLGYPMEYGQVHALKGDEPHSVMSGSKDIKSGKHPGLIRIRMRTYDG